MHMYDVYNRRAKAGHLTSITLKTDEPPNTPQARLIQAVILRAIRDFYSTDREVQRTADRWLFKKDNECPPWSFNWMCHILGRCPTEARNKIRSFCPEPNGSQPKGIRFKLRGEV